MKVVNRAESDGRAPIIYYLLLINYVISTQRTEEGKPRNVSTEDVTNIQTYSAFVKWSPSPRLA